MTHHRSPLRVDVRRGLVVLIILALGDATAFGLRPDLVASPVYDWAATIAPKWAWGIVMATGAAAGIVALIRDSSKWARACMAIVGTYHLVYAASILDAVAHGTASAATAVLKWVAVTAIILIWAAGNSLREDHHS